MFLLLLHLIINNERWQNKVTQPASVQCLTTEARIISPYGERQEKMIGRWSMGTILLNGRGKMQKSAVLTMKILVDLIVWLREIHNIVEVVVLKAQYYCLVTIVINANVDNRIPGEHNLYLRRSGGREHWNWLHNVMLHFVLERSVDDGVPSFLNVTGGWAASADSKSACGQGVKVVDWGRTVAGRKITLSTGLRMFNGLMPLVGSSNRGTHSYIGWHNPAGRGECGKGIEISDCVAVAGTCLL